MPQYNVLKPEHRIILKFVGLIDLQDLLNRTKSWLSKRQFEFHEYAYKAREPQLGELEMFWSGWRDDTEYIRVWVNLYIRLWDMQDVEVISKGKKSKRVKARMRINFRAHIETDYRRKWEGNRFFVTLRDFYEKNIIKPKLDDYKTKVELEVHSLIAFIRERLGMRPATPGS